MQMPGAGVMDVGSVIEHPGEPQQHPDRQSSSKMHARKFESFGSQNPGSTQSRVEMQSV
jgi:hypothetical protein